MIGLSSYAGVMEKSVNSTEEQQPCSLVNTCSNKQESGKKQTPKPVGGFVLVHAGNQTNLTKVKLHFLFSVSKQKSFSVLSMFHNPCFCPLSLGAGYHSESKAKEYKHVCKRACQRVSHFSLFFIVAAEIIG